MNVNPIALDAAMQNEYERGIEQERNRWKAAVEEMIEEYRDLQKFADRLLEELLKRMEADK